MAITAAQYLTLLQALLPSGGAWPREPDAIITQFLASLAEECSRLDLRTDDLLDEIDVRTTSQLLTDWERVLGLPDPCTGPLATVDERRLALVVKLAGDRGQSRAFFIALADALGYTVTIEEQVDGEPHKWRVNAPEVTVREFRCTSQCSEALRSWGNELLECAINRLKPAHTEVLFGYGGT